MLSPFVGWPLARPDYALQLAVSMQAEDPAVAPDAGHLEPAERRLVVALHGVDADVDAAQLPRDPVAAHRVRGPDVVVEPERCAVGERNSLVLVVERLHDDDRTEELLLGDAHLVLHAGEQRRSDVIAGLDLGPCAANDELRAVLPTGIEQRLHPVTLHLRDDRPAPRVARERVTYLEELRVRRQLLDELVVHRAVRDDASGRGADLARMKRPGTADA